MIHASETRLVGRFGLVLAGLVTLAAASLSLADAYDPPATYYNGATGTGATLKSQLYTITSAGFVARSYGDARFAFGILDRDPNNSNNILLAYNRASVNATWDSGVTFNREHLFARSFIPGATTNNSYVGPGSDLFELRPTNPTVNGNRGNYGYGSIHGTPPATYGVMTATNGSGTFWYPGADRGDIARSLFYMATRYGQGQANNLSLKNGQPALQQMGDLESLLHFHYNDEVDDFERRRNQYVYSQALNPSYYQGNRNPYIDHPEYVWSVFGSGANTSQLSVSAPAADGTSSQTLDFGKVIAGSNFSTRSATLTKTGNTPTTFDVSIAGDIASTLDGPRHAFGFDPGSRAMTVSIAGSTAAVGSRNGTITFDNTDIASGAATGQGASDGNDTIHVVASVVGHADPSFSPAESRKSLSLDFGILARDSSSPVLSFELANFSTIGNDAFTAALDIDSISAAGNTAAFTTTLATSSGLAAGDTLDHTASVVTTAIGAFSASYLIGGSDENIPGASSFAPIDLSLAARIAIGGDASLDDHVNFDDLLVVAQHYGSSDTAWETGDFNRDGMTSFDDLLVLAQNYGAGDLVGGDAFASTFAADWALARSLVPEPATISGLAAIAVLTRRRR